MSKQNHPPSSRPAPHAALRSSRNSFRRSRLEALLALLMFVVAGLWTISASYYLGYDQPAESIGGVPSWVIWGVLLPWLVFFIVHSWYSLFFIAGDEPPEES